MSSTLKDIATYLNVSVSTVSRALNNKGRVSDETCEKIFSVAESLNYRPNESARTLKMKRSSTIGVIIPDATNSFYSKMLKSIDEALWEKGYSIIFCDSDEKIERETEYFELLKSKNVSGMIIVTAGRNDIYESEKSLSNIVFVDNIPTISKPFSSVSIDNMKAAYELTQMVIDYGHTDIVMVCADLSETTGFDRLEGFKKCMYDNGLNCDEESIYKGAFRYRTGYEASKIILERKKRPTAIFAQNNVQAYGVIKGLQENGVKVPDDISVVCFDAIDETGLMCPKLTCIIQPVEEIGREAVSRIMKNLREEHGKYSVERINLDYEIVVGNSLKKF